MISVAEALAQILALGAPLPTERIPLRSAAGRVLAAPVVASRDQPPFDASAMDGYAIRDADHQAGARLTVVGEAGAGHAFAGEVGAGQAVRIFTGAPVPAGADRVVIQEDVTRDGADITLGDKLEVQSNIRPLGNDFKVGDRLSAPCRLRPVDLGLIAAMNVPDVTVARRPDARARPRRNERARARSRRARRERLPRVRGRADAFVEADRRPHPLLQFDSPGGGHWLC